jgi:hypothetical protein
MERICREKSSNNNPLHQHLSTISKVFEVFNHNLGLQSQLGSSYMYSSSSHEYIFEVFYMEELQNLSSASQEWKWEGEWNGK